MAQVTMYAGKTNSPGTTLASGITDSATSIALTDASVLPSGPNLATIGTAEDAETVLYTGKSTNTLTGVTRAWDGTAKAWDAGTSVYRAPTAKEWGNFKANIEDIVNSGISLFSFFM
jgi:hypothetical protein